MVDLLTSDNINFMFSAVPRSPTRVVTVVTVEVWRCERDYLGSERGPQSASSGCGGAGGLSWNVIGSIEGRPLKLFHPKRADVRKSPKLTCVMNHNPNHIDAF